MLFPEILKSELHAVRSTIEAYSKSAKLGGYEEASACGLRLQMGETASIKLRVTDGAGVVTSVTIDRWE